MKKIYKAKLTFKCQYSTGWFHKKLVDATCSFDSEIIVIAETDEEAIEKMKARDGYWNKKYHLPWYGWEDQNLNRWDYTILDETMDVYMVDSFTIEGLKNRLRADEFLAYCRQELYDINLIIK